MDDIKLTKEYKIKSLTDLQWPVDEVADDFTLYDLFKIVNEVEETFPGLAAIFGMPTFDKFWEQINLPRKDMNDDVKYLELYWSPDYETVKYKRTPEEQAQYDEEHKDCCNQDGPTRCFFCSFSDDKTTYYADSLAEAYVPNLMGFHGRGIHTHDTLQRCPELANAPDDDCGYAIEFTPLYDLKHLPIRIDTKMKFRPPFIKRGEKFTATDFVLKSDPTLWCFITSIFWELTFGGYDPKDIQDKLEELSSRCKEAKELMGTEDDD